jgi:hypothetical protein
MEAVSARLEEGAENLAAMDSDEETTRHSERVMGSNL